MLLLLNDMIMTNMKRQDDIKTATITSRHFMSISRLVDVHVPIYDLSITYVTRRDTACKTLYGRVKPELDGKSTNSLQTDN